MAKRKLFSRTRRWAEGAVIYQIYPRSFQDSNGDGVGDLVGITKRLDYLKDLGVNGIWISPFYPSPMADFGYDIKDYRDIDPLFGTLEDFKRLLDAAHRRDIKVIIDIVPNHTSDEHAWFIDSRRSRLGYYSDWYIWKDPKGYKNGKPIPPNNWLGMFDGQSGWKWVPEREQFYLHTFHPKQPDLNWQNPKVREAIKDILRYWMDMGVDGFRIDAVSFMAKDPDFNDNPPNPDYQPGESRYNTLLHVNNQFFPRLYSHLGELSSVLMEKPYLKSPRFMVTEAYVDSKDCINGYMNFYKAMNPRVASPFIFEGISRPWDARDWRGFLRDFQRTLLDFSELALPSYAFGNHDQSRLVSRYGDKRARAIAVAQLTLPGMIYVYNGEELGMHDVSIPADKIQDPGAVGGGGRDPERTPMQWSPDMNADFTTGTPWLPLARDFRKENVETELVDPNSFLNLYRDLIRLRHSAPGIKYGEIVVDEESPDHVLAYVRHKGRSRYLVLVNFSDDRTVYRLKQPGKVIISSLRVNFNHDIHKASITLEPFEALVIKHE